MSNIRIKDLSTEATSLGTDDFIPVDGNTSGTRKISKENLGTTLEIPDVGSAANEVSLNGMLGDMAFQSSDGVSVDNLEVTGKLEIDSSGNVSIGAGDIANNGSLHVYRSSATADLNLQSAGGSGRSFAIQSKTNGSLVVRDNNGAADRLTVGSGGHIGISNNSPGSANGSANNLVIGNATDSTSTGISIVTQPGQVGSLFFADGTSGVSGYIGRVQYNHGTNSMTFGVNGIVPWAINSSGNLAATGAYGIDFGQATPNAGGGTGTTGTPLNSVFSDYETGGWTPSLSTGAGESITYATQDGAYTKIGRRVICTARIQISSAATYGSYGHLQISGLPFVAVDSTDHMSFSYGGVYNLNSLLQVGDITGAQAQASGGASFYLQRGQYGGTSDVYYRTALLNTTGYLLFTVSYHTTA